MVVYLAGTFFLYIFAQTLSKKEIGPYWFLTYIFYIIKAVLFSVAIIIHSKIPTKKSNIKKLPYLDFN
jgi:biotin transporter BioY